MAAIFGSDVILIIITIQGPLESLLKENEDLKAQNAKLQSEIESLRNQLQQK
jgi:cell division protein FtsB